MWMDIKNILYDILFDKIFIGFILGILAAFFYDFLKNQFYLRRKKGFPVFYLHKCFTFSDNGDDRIFKIKYRTNSLIKSEIDFSYNDISQYAGLVFIPSNPFFRPYIKNNKKIEFYIRLLNIQNIVLEFKSNTTNGINKTFGLYEIPIHKRHHLVVLNEICDDLELWNDITELVFLVKRYNVKSLGILEIEHIKITT